MRVDLGLHEHLVVLLPEGLEVGVLLDDQVNDVQSRQDLSEVIEDLVIDHFLEGVGVHFVLSIEQTVHLVHDVLGKINDPPDGVKEVVEDLQSSADLEFLVARCVSVLVFEDEA